MSKNIIEKGGEHKKNMTVQKTVKKPYAGRFKRQVNLRMDEGTISYFKKLAQEIGVPYQTLINLYLRDCAASHKKLALHWKTA